MTDDDAYGTVIDGIVSIRIVERRLEYRSRETYLVGRRIIVRIYRLRTHEPFPPVHRLPEFRQIVLSIPVHCLDDILIVRQRRVYLHRTVVFPFVRISYLYRKVGKFFLSLSLGLLRHPVESGDMLAQGCLDIRHHHRHPLLVLRRKIPVDIHLAYSFGQYAVGNGHRPLPARLRLLHACHLFLEEVERSHIEIIAQRAARTGYHLRQKIVAKFLHRGAAKIFPDCIEVGRFAYYHLILRADSHCLEIFSETDTRICLLYLQG